MLILCYHRELIQLMKKNHWMRNRNLREIKCNGRMKWQSDRDYGKRADVGLVLRLTEFEIITF